MLRPALFSLLTIVSVATVACAHKSASESKSVAWNGSAAATYLDQRANAWLTWPTAERGDAASKTACLCCHTTVPYAMARPLLAGNGASIDVLTEQVKRRVERWDELDTPTFELMYDFNSQVKAESRGTEAVLNAVVLAFDDIHNKRAKPSPETNKAFTHLWQTQQSDGSWQWLSPRFELEPWESTDARYVGAAMAVLAVGVAPGAPPESAELKSALAYLRSNFAAQSAHNQLWALWATHEVGASLDGRTAIIDMLTTLQKADGGFALSSLGAFKRQETVSDGYATGLIVHVLRRVGLGASIAKRGTQWLEKNQTTNGAWLATSVNKPRRAESQVGQFMSDAATAFAVMALSNQ